MSEVLYKIQVKRGRNDIWLNGELPMDRHLTKSAAENRMVELRKQNRGMGFKFRIRPEWVSAT